MAPRLVLGPVLRCVKDGKASVWVQTDRACRVQIGDATSDTFCVCGHHYAIVVVSGLRAGEEIAYDVRLDGEVVWPLPGAPPSVIRIATDDEPLRIAFGSCLANGPQERPWTTHRRDDEHGLGPDALRGLALRVQQDPATRPDALLLLGDQAYADSAAPQLREWIRQRRPIDRPPGEGVADYTEYAELYRRTWSDPAARWLLSTVPTSMIFDDHEIIDDWNISESWVRDIHERPWWVQRITTGLGAYWVYQHLGNLPPAEVESNELLARIRAEDDGAAVLFAAAVDWDAGTTATVGAQWSYRWDVGGTTVVIVDSRNGRILEPGRRSILDEDEFSWLEDQIEDATGHILIGSSVPWLLARGVHDVETWNEAIADGAWGTRIARMAEGLRRKADLEHWAAFRRSWQRLADVIEGKVRAVGPTGATSVLVLSGDVHYSYAAQMHFPRGAHRPVWQLVSSPMRYPTPRLLEQAFEVAATRLSSAIGGVLARLAFVPATEATWSARAGPFQHNGVAELYLDGDHARVAFLAAHGDTDPRLEIVRELDLA